MLAIKSTGGVARANGLKLRPDEAKVSGRKINSDELDACMQDASHSLPSSLSTPFAPNPFFPQTPSAEEELDH